MIQPKQELTSARCLHLENGEDGCHVGFLKEHLVPRAHLYDGKSAVVDTIFEVAATDGFHCGRTHFTKFALSKFVKL